MIGYSDIAFTLPLRWPRGKPRHDKRFTGGYRHPLSPWSMGEGDDALRRLRAQFATAGIDEIEITSDQPMIQIGERTHCLLEPKPADPGVAVYFRIAGDACRLVCDQWDSVPNNIATIAAYIDALRWQIEQGGVPLAEVLDGIRVDRALGEVA